LNRLEEELL